MDAKKECAELLRELRKRYEYTTPDEMSDEDIEIRKLKWIITNELNQVDSTIFLLYTECASLRKLGTMLSCSHSTIRPEVNRIKKDIKNKLEKMKDIENI